MNSGSGNFLLNQLSPATRRALDRAFFEVELRSGAVVHAPGQPLERLIFPLDAVLTLSIGTDDRHSAEAAMIGNREAAGLHAFADPRLALARCSVTSSGRALEITFPAFNELFNNDPEFRTVMLSALQALMTRMSLSGACFRFHSLEQRYARWLLEMQDRTSSDRIRLTHQRSAALLGVRRSGLTMTAGNLTTRNAVRVERGAIVITDRAMLESISCDCYALLRRVRGTA